MLIVTTRQACQNRQLMKERAESSIKKVGSIVGRVEMIQSVGGWKTGEQGGLGRMSGQQPMVRHVITMKEPSKNILM